MFQILVFLGCCIIVSGTSFSQVKQKRSLFGDIRIASPLPSSSYGYGHPWSRNRNPWKTLKITSDLYESSSGLIYGSARPSPPSSPVVVTKHVIVEKPVPVPGQPVVLEKQVHVPVPVEKIVPVTVEKSVPFAVPQIIPYPVERPSPVRQIGIPVPIFIAPQGLLFGSGATPTSAPPAPSPTVPPPPPPAPIQPLSQPGLIQQPVQRQQQASPISLSVSAGLSGIPFQIPVQMLSNNQVPVQMISNNQVPVQMISNNQVPLQMIQSSPVPIQVIPSSPIAVQVLQSNVNRGISHGLDSNFIQVPTLETVPEGFQSNSLSGVEPYLSDDWKLD